MTPIRYRRARSLAVFIDGRVPDVNLGDVIILQELVNAIAAGSESKDHIFITVRPSGANVLAFIAALGLPKVAVRTTGRPAVVLAIWHRVRYRQLTTVFLSPGMHRLRPLLRRSKITKIASHGLLRVASALGVTIHRLGVSFSVDDLALSRIERAVPSTVRFGLRDSESLRLASASGVNEPRLVPDLAFGLNYLENRRQAQRDNLVISLQSGRGSGCRQSHENSIAEVLRTALQAIADTGSTVPITFLSQVNDLAATRRIAAIAGVETSRTVEFAGLGTFPSVMDTYMHASLVITNRLHVSLLAASVGAPVLVIACCDRYSKVHPIWSDMGLGNYVLNALSVTAGNPIPTILAPESLRHQTKVTAQAFADNRLLLYSEIETALRSVKKFA